MKYVADELKHNEVVKQRARVIVLQRTALVGVVVTGLFCVAVLVFTSVQGYFARKELVDCTTPHHVCYDKGQEATAKAVNLIVTQTIENAKPLHVTTRRVSVYAAYCANKHTGLDAIENCTEHLLLTDHTPPALQPAEEKGSK